MTAIKIPTGVCCSHTAAAAFSPRNAFVANMLLFDLLICAEDRNDSRFDIDLLAYRSLAATICGQ